VSQFGGRRFVAACAILVALATSTAFGGDASSGANSDQTLGFIFGENRQYLFEGHKGTNVQIVLKGSENFDRFVQSDNAFLSKLNEMGIGLRAYQPGLDITKNGTVSVVFGNPATVGADPFFAAMQFMFRSALVLELGPKLKNFHESEKYTHGNIQDGYCTSVTDYVSSQNGSVHYMIVFVDESSENEDVNECMYRNVLSFVGFKGLSLKKEIASIDILSNYRTLMKLDLQYGSSASAYYKRNIK